MSSEFLRPPAEEVFAEELGWLAEADDRPRPQNWRLSPWAVVTYLLGGKLPGGQEISTKYFGDQRLIEVAVATLVTDRALLLVGIPGTAKTWVAEHLTAAISADSSLLVQGTAGTAEEALRYGWNYARLLAEGPSRNALVASPVMRGMEEGKMVRIEELTRIPSEVQDSLLTVLSEKLLPIPELNDQVQAVEGFNIIATANDRDRGVNELSSALQRRFNTVNLPLPASLDEEVKIVRTRISQMGQKLKVDEKIAPEGEIRRLLTIFRELRSGVADGGKLKIKSPSATLSTAEAISVVNNGLALAVHFGDGKLSARDLAAGLLGAVIKNPVQDKVVWQEYLETVVKERNDWKDLYAACKELS